VKARQRQLFSEISSVNKLSSLDIVAFEERCGAGTTWLSAIISLLSGRRNDPVKPGHPYKAASVIRCFDLGFFPFVKTCLNFGANGCDECRNTYPSSNPRALHKSSSFVHFAIVGVIAANRRLSSMNGSNTTHNHGIAFPLGSTRTSFA